MTQSKALSPLPLSDEEEPCEHNPRGKHHELCPCNTSKNPIDGRPHCRWCGKVVASKLPVGTEREDEMEPECECIYVDVDLVDNRECPVHGLGRDQ